MENVSLVFHSLPEYLLCSLVFLISQIIYIVFGFGAGLLAVGLLALFMPNIQDIVVILLLINLPAEIYIILKSYSKIKWKNIIIIVAGIAVGIPFGTMTLKSGDKTYIIMLLAIFTMITGVTLLLISNIKKVSIPLFLNFPVGILSGFLSGILGTGGPPLIIFYQLKGVKKSLFRNSLIAIFFLISISRLVTYSVTELITITRIWSALSLFPAIILGILIGNKIHIDLKETTFKNLVSLVLFILGALLLIKPILF